MDRRFATTLSEKYFRQSQTFGICPGNTLRTHPIGQTSSGIFTTNRSNLSGNSQEGEREKSANDWIASGYIRRKILLDPGENGQYWRIGNLYFRAYHVISCQHSPKREDHLALPDQYCHINLPGNSLLTGRIMQELKNTAGKTLSRSHPSNNYIVSYYSQYTRTGWMSRDVIVLLEPHGIPEWEFSPDSGNSGTIFPQAPEAMKRVHGRRERPGTKRYHE
jgi:hypothetical protein